MTDLKAEVERSPARVSWLVRLSNGVILEQGLRTRKLAQGVADKYNQLLKAA